MLALPSRTSAAKSSAEEFNYIKRSVKLKLPPRNKYPNMSSLSFTNSLLSATILFWFSCNLCCFGIISLGIASLLFKHIFPSPSLSGRLNALQLWFGRWCITSTLVLICLNVFLRLLIILQRRLEKFAVLLLESLSIRQLFVIGAMGLVLVEWQEISKFGFICQVQSAPSIQRATLSARLSASKIKYVPNLWCLR
jgi:hypothetical protein